MGEKMKPTTIDLGPDDKEAELFAQSGVFFIKTLRDLAFSENGKPSVKADWKIVEAWLENYGTPLTDIELAKVQDAWLAYLAIGLAPNFSLQPTFDMLSEIIRKQVVILPAHKAPTKIMDVFDRLLATEQEIKEKRASDLEAERKRLEPLLKSFAKKSAKETNWWRRKPLETRKWIFFSSIWTIFVFSFYLLIDPFDRDGLDWWSRSEVFQMLIVASASWMAWLINTAYKKFVK